VGLTPPTAKILELSHAISHYLTLSHINLFSRDVGFFHKSVESEAGAGCKPGGEGLRHGRGDRWREECGMRWRSGGKGEICECVGLIPPDRDLIVLGCGWFGHKTAHPTTSILSGSAAQIARGSRRDQAFMSAHPNSTY
jgi:hypothetical protein